MTYIDLHSWSKTQKQAFPFAYEILRNRARIAPVILGFSSLVLMFIAWDISLNESDRALHLF